MLLGENGMNPQRQSVNNSASDIARDKAGESTTAYFNSDTNMLIDSNNDHEQ